MSAGAPVAIIMGSRSDWPTLKGAAEALDELGVAYESKVVSAHRTPERLFAFAQGRGRSRVQGDHRRRWRRGAPAGHGRLADHPAGAGRAGARQDAGRPRRPAFHRPDAGRRAGGNPGRRRGRGAQRRPDGRAHPRPRRSGAWPRGWPISTFARPPACQTRWRIDPPGRPVPAAAGLDDRDPGRRPARPHADARRRASRPGRRDPGPRAGRPGRRGRRRDDLRAPTTIPTPWPGWPTSPTWSPSSSRTCQPPRLRPWRSSAPGRAG